MSRVLQFYFEETGVVKAFAGSTAPAEYLMCYGQAVSRTEYPALFAVIGTTYGAGDGTTTFNVPDFRGRVAAGLDNMGGPAAGRLTSAGGVATSLGSSGGTQTHTLTEAQIPAHGHIVSGSAASNGAHTHSVSATGTAASAGDHQHGYTLFVMGSTNAHAAANSGAQSTAIDQTTTAGAHTHSVSVSGTAASGGAHTHTVSGTAANTGSGQAHPVVQPTITLNYIIKT